MATQSSVYTSPPPTLLAVGGGGGSAGLGYGIASNNGSITKTKYATLNNDGVLEKTQLPTKFNLIDLIDVELSCSNCTFINFFIYTTYTGGCCIECKTKLLEDEDLKIMSLLKKFSKDIVINIPTVYNREVFQTLLNEVEYRKLQQS